MFTIKLSRRSPFNLREIFFQFSANLIFNLTEFSNFLRILIFNLTEFFPIFCEFWYFIKIRNLLEHLALECICDSDFRSFFVESRNLPWKFYFRSVILIFCCIFRPMESRLVLNIHQPIPICHLEVKVEVGLEDVVNIFLKNDLQNDKMSLPSNPKSFLKIF